MTTTYNFEIEQATHTVIISQQELERRRNTILCVDEDTGIEMTAEDYLEAIYGDWNWFIYDETDPTPFER